MLDMLLRLWRYEVPTVIELDLGPEDALVMTVDSYLSDETAGRLKKKLDDIMKQPGRRHCRHLTKRYEFAGHSSARKIHAMTKINVIEAI